jgi:hypothetical protein
MSTHQTIGTHVHKVRQRPYVVCLARTPIFHLAIFHEKNVMASFPNHTLGKLLAILSILHQVTQTSASIRFKVADVGTSIITQTRRALNLNNIFGSTVRVPAHDRIISQPVFAVTTPWGSPYLLFEQKDPTETNLEFDESNTQANDSDEKMQKPRGRDANTNQVALYFLDEQDAMQLRDEMLQLEQMKGADMRITAFSLGKALRQACNFNNGLLTGQPIHDLTGKLPSPQEGGSLRYKIVPPRRELFYAARCKGKERVGLFATAPAMDANLMFNSFSAIGEVLRKRRNDAKGKDIKLSSTDSVEDKDNIRKAYSHMNGFAGIPVFYSPELRLSNNIKGFLRLDRKKHVPLFFSYEDLIECRTKSIAKAKRHLKGPVSTTDETLQVEVFNLMDVLTSMDMEQWRLRQNRFKGIVNLFSGKNKKKEKLFYKASDLQNIVFIPNSKTVKYKELISRVGSSKVKFLRPMRAWGKDA